MERCILINNKLNIKHIKMSEYVKRKQLNWIIGIVITLMIALFSCAIGIACDTAEKINEAKTSYAEIQSRLAGIETNLEWIKLELKNKD